MSFQGVMRTSVSGMRAQSGRLATAADNIANSDTTGYKRAALEFSSLIPRNSTANYNSGGVSTRVRYEISTQGTMQFTTSVSDLAVNGTGFLVVSNADGTSFLTRAGSFVPDGEGRLVNASGFFLMGHRITEEGSSAVANGFAGMEQISIDNISLKAKPSTQGNFQANFPAKDEIVAAGFLPSDNAADAEFSGKTSIVTYDSLGGEVILDVYVAKTADNTWEVAVYNRADAGPDGGFPYSAGPMTTETLDYDPSNGELAAGSPQSIAVAIPGGETMTLDVSETSQLATDYKVLDVSVNGNPPSGVELFEITPEGTVYATFENGDRIATHQIPLARVPSPDNLKPLSGNVFVPTEASGDVETGTANEAGFGSIVSGALEKSTVDLATELTTVIESQRSFTANSRVFQTGSELMDVLVNLSR